MRLDTCEYFIQAGGLILQKEEKKNRRETTVTYAKRAQEYLTSAMFIYVFLCGNINMMIFARQENMKANETLYATKVAS